MPTLWWGLSLSIRWRTIKDAEGKKAWVVSLALALYLISIYYQSSIYIVKCIHTHTDTQHTHTYMYIYVYIDMFYLSRSIVPVLCPGRLLCIDYIGGLCPLISGWGWSMVKGDWGGVGVTSGSSYVSFLCWAPVTAPVLHLLAVEWWQFLHY